MYVPNRGDDKLCERKKIVRFYAKSSNHKYSQFSRSECISCILANIANFEKGMGTQDRWDEHRQFSAYNHVINIYETAAFTCCQLE